MFSTIKLNNGYWKRKFPSLKYGVPDPLSVFSDDGAAFSEGMTSFNFSGVYKTTKAARHVQTQNYLISVMDSLTELPVIADIGASDGTTSLDLINRLKERFRKFYVTDYNIKCFFLSDRKYTYFFDSNNRCFMIASKKFVFYHSGSALFSFLFQKKLKKLEGVPKKELFLLNKELLNKAAKNENIVTDSYDIFKPWPHEKSDILIVANLLNNAYFSEDRISIALNNCYTAMTENGLFIAIRNTLVNTNDEIEQSTVFRKKGKKFEKINEINGGVDISSLITSLNFE